MLGKLFFWRKKKDEEEEEEDSEPKKKRKKRKKKKKPKPWGKRERLIVLSALLFTIGASALARYQSRGFEIPEISTGSIDLPSLDIFQEETIVLYGTEDEEKDPTQLINNIINRVSDLQGEYAFFVVRLDTGYNYGLNEVNQMPAASLIKLPVMAAMFKAEEEDEIEFYSEYTLRTSDKVEGSGSLSYRSEGFKIRYEDLIRLMGKESDNTAYKISKTLAGMENISDVMDKAGMSNTSVQSNLTTAEDIGSFYENLWNGNLINSDNRDQMLSYLTDTIYEDWIPLGVPGDVRVAHKYGTLDNVVNDAGIVYAVDPYVLVVLSSEISKKEANIVIPEISNMIYDFETNQ